MSELKRQARRLSDLFAELAEKGTWFEFNYYVAWRKHPCECPDLRSDLSNWRVAKPHKIIDLSIMIDSDIDMEFTNLIDFKIQPYHSAIGHLTGFDNSTNNNYAIHNGINKFSKCRIRQKYWHSWNGGKRPIPEGLAGAIRLRNKSIAYLNTTDKWEYDGVLTDCDIIAFWIDGPAEEYKYKWEK